MVARLAGLVLALGLALGGGVQAEPGANGPLERVDGDASAAPADTVFMARMDPIEIVAERISQSGPEDPTVTRLASASGRGGQTAARSDRAVAQPTRAGSRTRNQQARGEQGERDRSQRGVGVGGFVMNETFSVVGNDFYAAFYGAWSEPEDASLYTVSVREEPSPQFGARLTVEVGDTVIFRTFLRPNNRKIQNAAQRAARRAQVYVKKYHEPREVY